MPEVYRRAILKPPDLGADVASELRERLTAAVRLQQQLAARSPHVLHLEDGLEEDEHAFLVRHEPARPIPVPEFFDPEATLPDDEHLLRVAAALADALRAAQDAGTVHGGLCGGVVLESTDGILKVSDFGFAPALCAVLGVESYLELAVGPDTGGSPERSGTGVWEVLSPDESARDDRICGFIDPEKYGNQTLATFEAGSDVIAAGILLHLWAEHSHPMLGPEDHRSVVTAESMSFLPYSGARRKALRESGDRRIRAWCELVARMLQRLPRERPTGSDMVSALSQVGVEPAGPELGLKRGLDEAASLIEKGEWERARVIVAGILEAGTLPPDVADRAEELLQQCDAYLLLKQARDHLESDDWRRAQEPLDRLVGLSALPADVAEQADKVAARFRVQTEAHRTLEEIDQALAQLPARDPSEALDTVRQWSGQLDKLDDPSLHAVLQEQRQRLRTDLSAQSERLAARVEELKADYAVVRAWFEKLEDAWAKEQWDEVGTLLQARPSTLNWPPTEKANTQRREEQFKDVRAVLAWMPDLARAVDAEDVQRADRLLSEQPQPAEWPPTLRRELDELRERHRAAKAKATDHARAEQWIESVAALVAAKDWPAAQRQLAARPPLDHWPDEVLQREQQYRGQTGENLEALERLRGKIEGSFDAAEQAAQRGNFEQALEELANLLVDAGELQRDERSQVQQRATTLKSELQERRRRRLQDATDAARKLATAFVRDTVARECSGLLEPSVLDAAFGTLEWESETEPTRGRVPLKIAIRTSPDQQSHAVFEATLSFELDSDPPRIVDEDGAIRTNLSVSFRDFLRDRQAARLVDPLTPLRANLFPNAQIKADLDEPAKQATAMLTLLESYESGSNVETELAWDAAKLTWTYVDPSVVTGRAVEIAVGLAREQVKPTLLERAATLRPYEPVLVFEIPSPKLPDPMIVPTRLQLECRAAIEPQGDAARRPVMAIPVACPEAGRVVIDTDIPKIEAAFSSVVADAQEASRSAIERELKGHLAAAPLKVRVVSRTGRIRHPVDRAEFELRPKRGDRIPITATWNVTTFLLELPDDVLTRVDSSLHELAATARRPARTPTKEPVGEAKPGAARARKVLGRRAAALSAVVVIIALVAVAPFLWPGSPDEPSSTPPNLSDNTAAGPVAVDDSPDQPPDAGPSEVESPESPTVDAGEGERETPAPPEQQRSVDEAIATVREVLARSPILSSYNQELVSAGNPQGENLDVVCSFPGLSEARQTLPVTLSLDPEQPALSEQNAEALTELAADVETLLDDGPANLAAEVRQAVVAQQNSRWINVGLVNVRLDGDVSWRPGDERKTWLAGPVALVAGYNVPGDAGGTVAPGDQRELELGRIAVNLVAADNAVMPAEASAIEDLSDATIATLRDRWNADLETMKAAARDRADPVALSVTHERPAGVTALEGAVDLIVETERFLPRRFTVDWDSERLAFAEAQWQAAIDELLWARDACRGLDDALAEDEQHWLRAVLPDAASERVFELEAPGDGTWVLGVTAPWALRGDALPQNADDRLPIPVVIPQDWDRDSLVEALRNLGAPRYWDIIAMYRRLASGPYILVDPREITALSDALESTGEASSGGRLGPITDLLGGRSSQLLIAPRVELVGTGQPRPSGFADVATDAGRAEPSLGLSVAVRFGMATALPGQADGYLSEPALSSLDDAIRQLLQAKGVSTEDGGTGPSCTLTLGLDASGGVAMRWADLDATLGGLTAIVPELQQLDQLLSTVPERSELENELFAVFGGAAPVPGRARGLDASEAFTWLKRIWLAKGADQSLLNSLEGDLETFTVNRQARFVQRGGPSFSKGRAVEPTVFVEYFDGPRAIFALVWSSRLRNPSGFDTADVPTVQEGPSLVHLGSAERFWSVIGDDRELGAMLIDPVLSQVADACSAKAIDKFTGVLGLVLAPDVRPSVVPLVDTLFAPQTSVFMPLVINPRTSDYGFVERTWASLGELRLGELADGKCDYTMLPSLLSDQTRTVTPSDPARRWAVEKLDEALSLAGDGGS